MSDLDPSDSSLANYDTPNIGNPLQSSSPVSNHGQRRRQGRRSDSICSKHHNFSGARKKPDLFNREKDSKLRIMSLNLQGLLSKAQAFADQVATSKPHVILATETWLTPDVSSSECFPPNHTVFRKDRDKNGNKGGGALIAVRNDIIATHAEELDVDTEVLWIKLQIANIKSYFIGVFYRQPKLGADPLKRLHESLSKLDLTKNPNIWLGGDFNVPDIDWSVPTRKPSQECTYSEDVSSTLLNITDDFSLHQLAKEVNHVQQTSVHQVSNILQLLLVTNPHVFPPIVTGPGISDHFILSANPNLKPSIQTAPRRKVFKFSKANIEGLKEHMGSFAKSFLKDADKLPLEENWRRFESAILSATDAFVPSFHKSSRFNLPWITTPIKQLIRRKHRAFYKAKSTNTHFNWNRYRTVRKTVQKRLEES